MLSEAILLNTFLEKQPFEQRAASVNLGSQLPFAAPSTDGDWQPQADIAVGLGL